MHMTFDLYDFDIVKPGVAWKLKFPSPFHHSSQSLFLAVPLSPFIGINLFHDP